MENWQLLDLSMHKFLCIYFQPAYSIGSSANDTREEFEHLLSRVIATIFWLTGCLWRCIISMHF